MSYETLLYEVQPDRVATVTINRPDSMNSWNNQMCAEFARLWHEIKLDESVHAVVLRGAEGRAFSTGVDVKSDYGQPNDIWNHEDPGEPLSPKWNKCWKPVVCAVHGICTAGALYFVNEADIVICSEDAKAIWESLDKGRQAALDQGLAYTRLANPIGEAQVAPSPKGRSGHRLR